MDLQMGGCWMVIEMKAWRIVGPVQGKKIHILQVAESEAGVLEIFIGDSSVALLESSTGG